MYNQNTSKWTDEIDEVMRRYWCNGTSATECVTIIYASFGVLFTRNAIIGRAKRKGYKTSAPPHIHGRPKDPNKPKPAGEKLMRRRRRIAQQFGRPPTGFYVNRSSYDTPKSLDMTLLKLPPRCCLFPTSPDDATRHLFCGAPQEEGIPYCIHHARIAYRATARQVENEYNAVGASDGAP